MVIKSLIKNISKKNFGQKKKFLIKMVSFRLNRWKFLRLTHWKKEFERIQKENLVEILKCGYCQKTACESWHHKFLVANFAKKHLINLVIILI